MEDKKELSWEDFWKQVFETAMGIVSRSNCSTFKLFGYKFLDIRLIVYYHDCNQVFDFKKGVDKVEMTKFFTADKTDEDRAVARKQWKLEEEIDQPEIKPEDDSTASKG
jgi:hypothetical protein